jgi:hypothetical protein
MAFTHTELTATSREPHTMPLTKPNQELRRNLKAAAFALDDAAHGFRELKLSQESVRPRLLSRAFNIRLHWTLTE